MVDLEQLDARCLVGPDVLDQENLVGVLQLGVDELEQARGLSDDVGDSRPLLLRQASQRLGRLVGDVNAQSRRRSHVVFLSFVVRRTPARSHADESRLYVHGRGRPVWVVLFIAHLRGVLILSTKISSRCR